LFIKIDDLRIHYEVFGNGENIVLLPGWGCNANHWAKVSDYLSVRFKVWVLDLPGFGLSSKPISPWGTKEYAMLVAKFLQELKIQNPILLGHSFGGKIAFYLVAKDLIDVKKLILVASSGIKAKKTISQVSKIWAYKILKKIAFCPPFNIFLKPFVINYQNRIGSTDYRNAEGIMRTILVKLVNEDFQDLLTKIKIPTLLIWGALDMNTKLMCGELMQKLIPNSQLIVFPHAEHFPHLSHFKEFVTNLDQFLVAKT
jgi:pimeloyl-ACP methyl ester carboxylesterase